MREPILGGSRVWADLVLDAVFLGVIVVGFGLIWVLVRAVEKL